MNQPAGVSEADVERATDAAIGCMFAPHEIPVSAELRSKIRETQIAAITAALAGRAVVPLEPSEAMIDAAFDDPDGYWFHDTSMVRADFDAEMRSAYRAMLAASVEGGS